MKNNNFAAKVDHIANLMANVPDDALLLAPAMKALLNAPIHRETSEAWIAALAAARSLERVRHWYAAYLAEKGGNV